MPLLLISLCNGDNAHLNQKYSEAVDLYGQNRQGEAQKILQTIIDDDYDFHPAHVMLGKIAFYNRQYDVAMEHFEAALDAFPNSVDALYWRARIHMLGEDEGAIQIAMEDLDEVIRRDSTHADAWHAKGMLYEKQGKTDLAMAAYQTAIKHFSRSSLTFLQLAMLYEQAHLYDRADMYFADALKNSNDPRMMEMIEAIRKKRTETTKPTEPNDSTE